MMIAAKLWPSYYYRRALYSSKNYCFSVFKKQFRNLVVEDYNSLGDMSAKMRQFEMNLQGQQRVKYDKYLDKLSKKMKRLACKQAIITNNPAQALYQSIIKSFYWVRFEPDPTNIYGIKLQAQILSKFLNQQQVNIPGLAQNVDFMPKIPKKVNLDILYDWYQNIRSNNIQFFVEIVGQYCYLDCQFGNFRQLYTNLIILFQIYEEQLCKNIFKDYSEFAKEIAASKGLQKQKVYKGDFNFMLLELSESDIVKLVDILQILCEFGQITNKVIIATQLLIEKYYDKLAMQSLGKIFQILTISGNSNKIDSDLPNIVSSLKSARESMSKQQYMESTLNILHYITSNKMQNRFLVEQLLQQLQTITSNNEQLRYKKVGKYTIEYYMYKLFGQLLRKKYEFQLPYKLDVVVSDSKKLYEKMQQKDVIKLFLNYSRYSYQQKQCALTGLNTYYFDNDRIVKQYGDQIKNQYKAHQKLILQPLPLLFYNPQYTNINIQKPFQMKITYQDNTLVNALVNYIKEYQTDIFIKPVNLGAMYHIETTTNKGDFIKNKLKGVAKPYKKRYRIFDFGPSQ